MKLKSSMPKKEDSPLPRTECLCSICREILLEPVTLPCNHTLCRPCFQMTVEKASLCCPFCRLRVSTWARRNARAGTLVNKELWEIIQRQYPGECERRACGLDTVEDEFEDGFTPYPAPQLCKPGEIRQEYEEEISKIEAERLRREEEERKASEEYIKKLLEEEEAQQQRLSLERTQMELEQLKRDEEMARMLSSDLNESIASIASSVHVSPVASPVIPKKSVSTKSCKSVKSKPTQSGDIERFLSPKNVNIGSHIRNGDMGTSMESVAWVLDESDCDDAMPTLTPQSPFTVNSSMEETDSQHQLPSLSKHSPVYKSALMSPGLEDSRQAITIESHESTASVEFSPPRCSNSLDSRSRPGITSTPEQWHNETSKRTLNFTRDEDHGNGPSCLENSFTAGSHAERLKELEETLHEKKLQEEQDRLMALKLQKLLDKELKQLSRQKGSPDEYRLRPKRNTVQQEPIDATLKRTAPKRSAEQANVNSSESEESSNENQKPAPKRRVQSHQVGGSRARKTSEPSKILKPSNKQQTILDMFQKSARK